MRNGSGWLLKEFYYMLVMLIIQYNPLMEKPQNGNRVRYNKSDNNAVQHMEKIIFIILPTYRDTGDCIFVSIDVSHEIDVVIEERC